jgi:hypothetical protein
MGEWSDLPYEVIFRLAKRLFDSITLQEEQWIFVSKNLHTLFQSFKFQSIHLALNQDSDQAFQAILKSPLQPWSLGKEIHLQNLMIIWTSSTPLWTLCAC